MGDVYIVQAYRTAVGKSKKGKINFVRPDDLGAQLIKKYPILTKKRLTM
jgi:acetyl-CoA acetyltransferase